MDVPIPTPCRAISFVSPLIQALIAGRKVQTRRLISPAPDCAACDSSGQPITYASGKPIRCRFGRPGDRLWVQERWTDRQTESTLFDGQVPGIIYAADLTLPLKGRWKPARFMPRRHSRITLNILAVRIERLTQISHDDAMAEGFDPSADGPDPIAWFRKIWDELSDDPTNWAADPWVWVIEFERTRQPSPARYNLRMSEPERKPVDLPRIERAVREILLAVGEDPDREGLLKTPSRVAKSYAELLSGLRTNPREHLHTVFHEKYDEVVLLRDIAFHSLCEHHLLPFIGRAHVAYLPNGKVVGLSKLARLVEGFARRPQVQERLTTQIADALMEELSPLGAACVIEASHSCMTIRGVQKPGATMVTSALRGTFKSDARTRSEILTLMYSEAKHAR